MKSAFDTQIITSYDLDQAREQGWEVVSYFDKADKVLIRRKHIAIPKRPKQHEKLDIIQCVVGNVDALGVISSVIIFDSTRDVTHGGNGLANHKAWRWYPSEGLSQSCLNNLSTGKKVDPEDWFRIWEHLFKKGCFHIRDWNNYLRDIGFITQAQRRRMRH